MTCREELRKQYPDYETLLEHIIATDCPEDHISIEEPNYCQPFSEMCEKCWDRKVPETQAEAVDRVQEAFADAMGISVTSSSTILDSGDRTQFESGAVRDMREGKGRCDLMPLEVVANCLYKDDNKFDSILYNIRYFMKEHATTYLYNALRDFCEINWGSPYTMLLEVAKHFEEGAKKYGESNWQKGIPVHCYIDSAIRHYLKWCRGDTDEPHDRAFCWNLMCCIWEVDYSPRSGDSDE